MCIRDSAVTSRAFRTRTERQREPAQGIKHQHEGREEMKPENDDNLMFPALPEGSAIPEGAGRRAFIVRSAVIGAAAVMTGCDVPKDERAQKAAAEAAAQTAAKPKALGTEMSDTLNVVKKSKGPVM